MCRLSSYLEASTSWNPQGLSSPVMRLLYLFHIYIYIYIYIHKRIYIIRSACRWLLRAETCRCKVLRKTINKVVLDSILSLCLIIGYKQKIDAFPKIIINSNNLSHFHLYKNFIGWLSKYLAWQQIRETRNPTNISLKCSSLSTLDILIGHKVYAHYGL